VQESDRRSVPRPGEPGKPVVHRLGQRRWGCRRGPLPGRWALLAQRRGYLSATSIATDAIGLYRGLTPFLERLVPSAAQNTVHSVIAPPPAASFLPGPAEVITALRDGQKKSRLRVRRLQKID